MNTEYTRRARTDVLRAGLAFGNHRLRALVHGEQACAEERRALFLTLIDLELGLVPRRTDRRVDRATRLLLLSLLLGRRWLLLGHGLGRGGASCRDRSHLGRLRRQWAGARLREVRLLLDILVGGVWVELGGDRLVRWKEGTLSLRELIHEVFDGFALRIERDGRPGCVVGCTSSIRGRLARRRYGFALLLLSWRA